MDWILHIDTDELVYPGGSAEYSIQRALASVPDDVDTLVFPNYESLPERDDVQDPFTEVRSHTAAPALGSLSPSRAAVTKSRGASKSLASPSTLTAPRCSPVKGTWEEIPSLGFSPAPR